MGASDAAYENSVGSGGFLVATLNGHGGYQGVARAVDIEPDLYSMWEPCETTLPNESLS